MHYVLATQFDTQGDGSTCKKCPKYVKSVPAEEFFELVLAPLIGVLFGPVPVVDVGRVRPFLYDPARVALAPLGHRPLPGLI